MNNLLNKIIFPFIIVLFLIFSPYQKLSACSTFKLQKGNELIYGHNLNYGDIGVPGLIYINKRGIFKLGRTWSELTTKDRLNPSSHSWISKYGSVTFNAFCRDFPDGGMNEIGLYIWEMNEDGDYPKREGLPQVYELNWMQYVLDHYSTVDEVVQGASEINIEGPGKHYFVGDARGNCVAIAFIDGNIVVNKNQTMPVPGLFNTPYNRELKILKYYRGFGGFYEPVLNDYKVPRFVKTAVMLRDYDPTQNAVEYGFQMLDNLKVFDVAEWSIIFDAVSRDVYFRTRLNRQIKHFSMDKIDFSNNCDVLILNMDIEEGGDVLDQFHTYTNEEAVTFMEKRLVPILPKKLFTSGGLTVKEFLDRFSTHSDGASLSANQFFRGVWKSKAGRNKGDREITVILETKKDAVSGKIFISRKADSWFECDHLQLIGNRLKFTFRIKDRMFKEGFIVEGDAVIKKNRMELELSGIEELLGGFTLYKQH